MEKNKTLITSEMLANYLNLKTRAISRLRVEKNLPYFKIGGQIRFREEDVDKWLKSCKK